jgi:hypothetical protein
MLQTLFGLKVFLQNLRDLGLIGPVTIKMSANQGCQFHEIQ